MGFDLLNNLNFLSQGIFGRRISRYRRGASQRCREGDSRRYMKGSWNECLKALVTPPAVTMAASEGSCTRTSAIGTGRTLRPLHENLILRERFVQTVISGE